MEIQPFLYVPASGKLSLFTQLTVEIEFPEVAVEGAMTENSTPSPAGNPYELFFQSSLANYDVARKWRTEPLQVPGLNEAMSITPSSWPLQGTAYRIETKGSGIYAVSFEELQAADPAVDIGAVDPHHFHLYNQGQAVAIEVNDRGDASFDPGDTLYFYAESIKTKYTDTNAYWLSWDNTNGLRWSTVNGTPIGAGTVLTQFITTQNIEQDLLYVTDRWSSDGDHWFWDHLRVANSQITGTYSFDVKGWPLSRTL